MGYLLWSLLGVKRITIRVASILVQCTNLTRMSKCPHPADPAEFQSPSPDLCPHRFSIVDSDESKRNGEQGPRAEQVL